MSEQQVNPLPSIHNSSDEVPIPPETNTTTTTSSPDATKELPLKPEFIMKSYKQMADEQLVIAVTHPDLVMHLLAIVSKLNDHQLEVVTPFMSLDHIKVMVPKLQLQQTGVAVQVMNPSQVRQTVVSLTSDDRNILMQNIALLTSSSNKDELQSFMAFVDPLAMCIAAQIVDLAPKLIEAAGVMTIDQIKIMVPLLSCEQIRQLLVVLEDDTQISTAIGMIDKKEELCKLLEEDLNRLEKRKGEVTPRAQSIGEQLPEIELRIKNLSMAANKGEEYESIARTVRNTKTEIETLQQTAREVQAALKLPLKMFATNSEAFIRSEQLSKEAKELAKQLHGRFSNLDSLISMLSQHWQQIKGSEREGRTKKEEVPSEKDAEPDSVFEDDDRAIVLYEAVKEIGNPDAVGNHYSITWNDIIQTGFRTAKDFKEHGILTLEQLQQYINSNRPKSELS